MASAGVMSRWRNGKSNKKKNQRHSDSEARSHHWEAAICGPGAVSESSGSMLFRTIFDRLSLPSASVPDHKILRFLGKYFVDLDNYKAWMTKRNQLRVKKINKPFSYMEYEYGKSAAVAYYTLVHKGGVRFHGHQDWLRVAQGKNSTEFLKYKDVPIESVDLSNCDVTCTGLDPILELEHLRFLNLSHCPYIDDWSLSRLNVLHPTLEVLILAGCPQITERGLASLHHLQKLKHLDVSDLPNVSHKGLTRILLEEVLPACEIVGMEYSESLDGETSTPSET
ncbi:PREDICTED: ATP synthase subunit s-like protein [Nanorana parkeri]|uniref:ATP synthase subunit s-like protein n=1 Tax=Nanorana parkeri TaxID=125878 RepID=UPI0008541A7A|nr:PREDICTED: ATP synthase subunit s-like protein [Nanorana parkeri]